ncbi:MAG: NAD(P)H-binding protein [Candidatus Zixiibacteriota bacterium]
MKVLVLGASGYVGQRLVPYLLTRGHNVRCMVRDPGSLTGNRNEVFAGNALDIDALMRAMGGVEKVVYLIHSMRSPDKNFEQTDMQIATNVAEVARHYGIKQIVYLGALGERTDLQTPHLRSRHRVGDILRSSEIAVTELRAAVIVGSGSASFEMIKHLVQKLPIMICPRWVQVKTQPIAIADVLDYVASSLTLPDALGRTIDIGGADILSYRQMLIDVARILGLKRLIIPVPVLTPWLSSHWVNLVTPIEASLARALIESVRSETVCSDDLARRIFHVTPMNFKQAARAALEKEDLQSLGINTGVTA